MIKIKLLTSNHRIAGMKSYTNYGLFALFAFIIAVMSLNAQVISPQEFNADDPMEQRATPQQTANLIKQHRSKHYLLFPEDRQFPIRMTDALPQRWIEKGPSDSFGGNARPGEFYVFQVGLYAVDKNVSQIQIAYSDLTGPDNNSIPAANFRCFNLGGTDWLGRTFRKTVAVKKGNIQPLWFGVDIPQDTPSGKYKAQITIAPQPSFTPMQISITLTVSGSVLKDHGDSDLWNYSRLRWLDSTLALDEEVTAPYIPLQISANTITCLGRKITITNSGLPKSILSKFDHTLGEINQKGTEILARPVSLNIQTENGQVNFTPDKLEFTKHTPATIEWKAWNNATDFSLVTHVHMEYDGHIAFRMTLTAKKTTSIKNINLDIPIKSNVAKYMMGMGRKGGLIPDDFQWKWDKAKHQDSLWIGDVNAGLQCKLKGPNYSRPLVNIYYKYKQIDLPDAWYNEGKGGVTVGKADNDATVFNAYSGPRTIQAGQQLNFNFDLLITPVKPVNTKAHFHNRYYHNGSGATIPKWISAAKQGSAEIINIHHGNDLNPYINYPFLPETTKDLAAYIETVHNAGLKAKTYYTVRELTNHVAELWALRSLGDEVFLTGGGNNETSIINPRGADPWLQKHLRTDYVPAWRHPFSSGKYAGHVDASIVTSGMSRWHNYYIEGLQYLVRNLKIDGIYIDDVAYDRKVMQRVRKVFDRNRPGSLIDVHSWNHFNSYAGFANCANLYMEHFPYIDSIWFGEGFNYNESPDYWLVEISGIPFGLMGQMLQGGGNPWRGMIYGMTGRLPWSGNPTPVWNFWREFDIENTKIIGYWAPNCPVKTDIENILATIYKGRERSIVSIASWAKEPAQCKLKIDFEALGIDPKKASIYAPPIKDFQPEMLWKINDPIPVIPGRGWLLVIDTQERELTKAEPRMDIYKGRKLFYESNFQSVGLEKDWTTHTSKRIGRSRQIFVGR